MISYYEPNFIKKFLWEGFFLEKVYFRSPILERPRIGEYKNIFDLPVMPENVVFMFFSMCWCYLEAYNTGTQKWFSIVQYSCISIWDLKYTFSGFLFCFVLFCFFLFCFVLFCFVFLFVFVFVFCFVLFFVFVCLIFFFFSK